MLYETIIYTTRKEADAIESIMGVIKTANAGFDFISERFQNKNLMTITFKAQGDGLASIIATVFNPEVKGCAVSVRQNVKPNELFHRSITINDENNHNKYSVVIATKD